MRIQKFLAQAGFGSRRQCEELIEMGRVTVDGEVVAALGSKCDPETQTIEVDGTRVKQARYQYFMVNKPVGVVSTSYDQTGRARVIDLVNTDLRVYNVGRLDKSSEGLILVTNDGDLANRLTHPRYAVPKTYIVHVAGQPRWEDLKVLMRGVRLAEGVARVTELKVRKRLRSGCELQIVLDEGRNRQIRRILARIGHKVTRLKRVAIGPLPLGDLAPGSWRRLEPFEVEALRAASSQALPRPVAESRPITEGRFARQREERREAQRSQPGRKKSKSTRPAQSTSRSPSAGKSSSSARKSSPTGSKRSHASQDGRRQAEVETRDSHSRKRKSSHVSQTRKTGELRDKPRGKKNDQRESPAPGGRRTKSKRQDKNKQHPSGAKRNGGAAKSDSRQGSAGKKPGKRSPSGATKRFGKKPAPSAGGRKSSAGGRKSAAGKPRRK